MSIFLKNVPINPRLPYSVSFHLKEAEIFPQYTFNMTFL